MKILPRGKRRIAPARPAWARLIRAASLARLASRRARAALSLAAALFLFGLQLQGCAIPRYSIGPKRRAELTLNGNGAKGQLLADLREYERALDDIWTVWKASALEQAPNRAAKRQIGQWRSLLASRYGEAFDNKDPLAAMLDAWTINEQVMAHLRRQPVRQEFGPRWNAAMQAARQSDALLDAIVETYIAEEVAAVARDNIEAYIRSEPLIRDKSFLGGLFDFRSYMFSMVDVGKQTVDSVAAIPLMPLRTSEGIQRGTASLADFNRTASGFSVVVENLPQQFRRELETLLTAGDDKFSTVSAMLRDAHAMAEAFDRLALNAADLSRDLRLTITEAGKTAGVAGETGAAVAGAARELAAMAQTLAALIGEFQSRRAPASEAGSPPNPSFDASVYAEAASAIGAAAAEVRLATHEIRLLVEQSRQPSPRPAGDDRAPFNVLHYAEAARAIEAGGAQTRALLRDARDAVGASDLAAAGAQVRSEIAPLMDETEARLAGLADRLMARGALLIVLFFFCAALCHWIKRRLAPR